LSKYLSDRETEIFFKQEHILSACCVKSPVVFDVGGNIGQSILHYRNALPECRIHSFEPNPDAFAELESQWGDCGEVSLVRLALAEKAGVMDFYATRRSEMSSLLVPEPWLNILSPDRKYDFTALQVQCGTLDAYCKEMNIDHVDILKIDVQGGELRVLEGGGADSWRLAGLD